MSEAKKQKVENKNLENLLSAILGIENEDKQEEIRLLLARFKKQDSVSQEEVAQFGELSGVAEKYFEKKLGKQTTGTAAKWEIPTNKRDKPLDPLIPVKNCNEIIRKLKVIKKFLADLKYPKHSQVIIKTLLGFDSSKEEEELGFDLKVNGQVTNNLNILVNYINSNISGDWKDINISSVEEKDTESEEKKEEVQINSAVESVKEKSLPEEIQEVQAAKKYNTKVGEEEQIKTEEQVEKETNNSGVSKFNSRPFLAKPKSKPDQTQKIYSPRSPAVINRKTPIEILHENMRNSKRIDRENQENSGGADVSREDDTPVDNPHGDNGKVPQKEKPSVENTVNATNNLSVAEKLKAHEMPKLDGSVSNLGVYEREMAKEVARLEAEQKLKSLRGGDFSGPGIVESVSFEEEKKEELKQDVKLGSFESAENEKDTEPAIEPAGDGEVVEEVIANDETPKKEVTPNETKLKNLKRRRAVFVNQKSKLGFFGRNFLQRGTNKELDIQIRHLDDEMRELNKQTKINRHSVGEWKAQLASDVRTATSSRKNDRKAGIGMRNIAKLNEIGKEKASHVELIEGIEAKKRSLKLELASLPNGEERRKKLLELVGLKMDKKAEKINTRQKRLEIARKMEGTRGYIQPVWEKIKDPKFQRKLVVYGGIGLLAGTYIGAPLAAMAAAKLGLGAASGASLLTAAGATKAAVGAGIAGTTGAIASVPKFAWDKHEGAVGDKETYAKRARTAFIISAITGGIGAVYAEEIKSFFHGIYNLVAGTPVAASSAPLVPATRTSAAVPFTPKSIPVAPQVATSPTLNYQPSNIPTPTIPTFHFSPFDISGNLGSVHVVEHLLQEGPIYNVLKNYMSTLGIKLDADKLRYFAENISSNMENFHGTKLKEIANILGSTERGNMEEVFASIPNGRITANKMEQFMAVIAKNFNAKKLVETGIKNGFKIYN